MNHTGISSTLLALKANEVTAAVYGTCIIVHYGLEELLSDGRLFGLFVLITLIYALFRIID